MGRFPEGSEPVGDDTIVNPVKLPLDRQVDVCLQCHLQGTISVLKAGMTETSFRPGMRVSDVRSIYMPARDGGTTDFGIASHGERMMMSRCYSESGGEMTCTTCHDPHMALKETTQADYNQACAQCHKVGELDETVEGHRADGDCTSCHMRQGETSNIIHVNFTDHWIRTEADSVGVSFEEARDRHRGKAVVLEPFFDEVDSAAAVRQGVAYVMYWEAKHSHPAYLKEAVVALEAGLAKAPDHQEGQYFLGLAYRHLGRLPDSVERLRWAIALEPKDARAHFQFGRVLQEQEKDADAISAYQASLLANPLDAVAYNNLGNVFAKLGDSDRAIAPIRKRFGCGRIMRRRITTLVISMRFGWMIL
jgi:predicted CXXCH cytochrome family protein